MTQLCCSCVDLYQLPLVKMLLGDSFHPGGLALSKKLAEATLINRQSKVLDLAGGNGTTAHFLAQQYGCHVTVADAGDYPDATSHRKVNRLKTDVHSLPVVDDLFDVVICECALCTFADPKAVLAEIKRVLKPAGFIGFSDMMLHKPLPHRLKTALLSWLCIAETKTPDNYLLQLKEAGFSYLSHRSHPQLLTDLIQQIKSHWQTLEETGLLDELQRDIAWQFPQVSDWQALEQFILAGHLSYGTYCGRLI